MASFSSVVDRDCFRPSIFFMLQQGCRSCDRGVNGATGNLTSLIQPLLMP
jgi:hypothetical protein